MLKTMSDTTSSLHSGQLAVCTWSLQPESPEHLVSLVRDLGLDTVQLALNDHRGSAGGEAMGRALLDADIRIASGMFGTIGEDYTTLETIRRTGGLVPDEHWQANLALARETAATADKLGIRLVSLHAGFLPEDHNDPACAVLADRLEQVAAVFAGHDIRLALETGQEEAGHLDTFLASLKAENVGVNFDPANMILYAKGDPIAALETLLPRLYQIHIKDAIATSEPGTWGSEVPVGEGQVDWPAFLSLLKRAGYTGALCIEREAGDDRPGDIRRAKEFISSLL